MTGIARRRWPLSLRLPAIGLQTTSALRVAELSARGDIVSGDRTEKTALVVPLTNA